MSLTAAIRASRSRCRSRPAPSASAQTPDSRLILWRRWESAPRPLLGWVRGIWEVRCAERVSAAFRFAPRPSRSNRWSIRRLGLTVAGDVNSQLHLLPYRPGAQQDYPLEASFLRIITTPAIPRLRYNQEDDSGTGWKVMLSMKYVEIAGQGCRGHASGTHSTAISWNPTRWDTSNVHVPGLAPCSGGTPHGGGC